ncbi:hypothetical protein AYO49_01025 [Verrucomicrobiaceae bacterium SCGC AG-212-N21]|nr:hypothetical protein AYO49_01025 [Verrucomicrobiaceae bacterium SCGC AG-212-N21]
MMVDPSSEFSGTKKVRQQLRRKSVWGSLCMAAGSAGDVVVRLVSISILARLLNPEEFGLVGMITAVTAIATQVSHLSLSTVTVQRKEITHQQISNLFWINSGFGLVVAGIICALAPLVADFYHDARLLPATLLISLSFVWMGFGVQHEALLIRQMKQAQSAAARLAASFLGACVAVVLALRGYGFWSLIWQEIARSFFLMIAIWVFCPWKPALPGRSGGIGELLRFGRDLTLAQLLNTVVTNLDRLLLGRFLGGGAVGFYRQAQQLMMAPIEHLNSPIQSVSQPGLSMLQGDPLRYRRYYQRMVLTVSLLTMPAAAFAAVFAEELTLLVLGTQWLGVAVLLRVFALAAFVRPALGTAGVVLITCGRADRLLKLSFLRNAVLVLFTIVGLRWGAVGVAIAQLANTLVLLVPVLAYSFRESPVSVSAFAGAVRYPVLCSLLMVGGMIALRPLMPEMPLIALLALNGIIGGLLFLAGAFLIPGGRREMAPLVAALWDTLSMRKLSGQMGG